MPPIRAYADTSVYGGVFDEEFATNSIIFFDQVKEGRFLMVISPVLEEEISCAPDIVKTHYQEMARIAEPVTLIADAVNLQEMYLEKGVVTRKFADDALHVAFATVSRCILLVSWNFKHIVHYDKITLYNAINLASGYGEIRIHTPSEVIDYEDEDI